MRESRKMDKESLEVIESPEDTIAVVYDQPKFLKRCFANFLDFLFFFLAFIAFFIITEKCVQAGPTYTRADEIVAVYRSESGLFRYSTARKTWENVSTWLDNNNDTSYDFRVTECKKSINDFIDYVAAKSSPENHETIVNNYNESRLFEKMVDVNGKPLFIWNDSHSEIIHNPESTANSEYYYTRFYREYTLSNCGGYMVAFFPEYNAALKTMSNLLFFLQIPVTLLLAGFTIYLMPVFIFRRGKMTFGKRLNDIGLVDSNVLSPSIGRYIARWSIFFFGEIILSLFTFGIPLIASFSLMAFSKRKQGFPDFMLGLTEVDAKKQKIYFSKYEVSVDHVKPDKKPVDFKPEDRL